MRRGYADTPQGQIHYRTAGSGEPVLLLHQIFLSSAEYHDIIPRLAKSYRVIAMDTLGHGNSDNPPGGISVYKDYKVDDFTIEDHAGNIISFLDALDIKKASLIGHHGGATLAAEVAAGYPDRVDKLVLSGCMMIVWEKFIDDLEAGRAPRRSVREQMAPLNIKDDGQMLMHKWNVYKKMLPGASPEQVLKMFILGVARIARYIDPYDYYAYEVAHYRYKIRPRLGLIQSPTLLMSGDKDPACHELDDICSLIPRCRTKRVEGEVFHPGWD